MSVVLVVIVVMLMLNVPTLLGASPVPVTKDTVEMGLTVLVSYLHITCSLGSGSKLYV